jgi:capsular polysaccharide biosynthesis protein
VLESFEELSDVTVIDVELPSGPAPVARTRSVQPNTDPRLHSEAVPRVARPAAAIVPDGRLATNGGAVLTPDGRLVLETLWDEEHRRRHFDPLPELPAPRRLSGRHASIVSLWSENYFHWLFEALPRLAVLRASGVSYDTLIVPDRLSRFHRETLEILGIADDQLTPFTGEHLQADELVWVTPPAPIGRPTRFSVDWLRHSLGGGVASAPEPVERVYLQRTGTRRVANERPVLRALRRLGFIVVDPGTLSFREQLRLFASTAIAVGPHGAAFANGIFADELTVLELYQPAHVNASIVSVMAAAGHPHWSLICKRVPSPHRRSNQPMWVSVGMLLRSLNEVGVTA